MSDNLQKSFKDLKFISQLPPRARKIALSKLSCNECYYQALREIARNISNKNIKTGKTKISKVGLANINKFSSAPKKLAKKKREVLVTQSGGWIWALIPVIASVIEIVQAINGAH